MKAEDLKRFAEDLQTAIGLEIVVKIDPNPDGLHVLHVNKTDFFFNADGSGLQIPRLLGPRQNCTK